MNYKALKKIISAAENGQPSARNATFMTVHAQPPEGLASVEEDISHKLTESPTASPLPTTFESAKALFFFRIERELDKVKLRLYQLCSSAIGQYILFA